MSDTQVKELQPAPDFTLPAIGSDTVVKNGQVQLSALSNHVVVLYFYPKDDSPGCTAEACSFRDANREMQKRGLVVLGVSFFFQAEDGIRDLTVTGVQTCALPI